MALKRYGLPKQERLRKESDISALFNQGESGFVHPLRYVYQATDVKSESGHGEQFEEGLKTDGGAKVVESPVSILVSVSKRNHKRANKRNLNKRRIREAYRLNKELITDCDAIKNGKAINIAFIYASKDMLEYKIIENAIKRILTTVAGHI